MTPEFLAAVIDALLPGEVHRAGQRVARRIRGRA